MTTPAADTAPPSTAPVVVPLPPSVLERHPLNPRPPLAKDERLGELVESIRVHGQKQPCVVIPHGDKHRLVIGHRRAAACAELGRQVLCIVEDLDDNAALAIMVSDNEVHADVDPFLEAKAVSTLLGRPGWTLQAVAEALGKSPRWVALRANLGRLTKEARAALAKNPKVAAWPVHWLERVATLSEAEQLALVKDATDDPWRFESFEDLERAVASHTNKLGAAPWNLEDATLLPDAGSCSSCPKQSLRVPGLFDDGSNAGDIKKALCRDLACWRRKLEAHAEAKVQALRKDHPQLVAIKGRCETLEESRDTLKVKGLRTLHQEEYAESKKGTKGALPALVTAGKGKGKVVWVKPKKGALDPKPRGRRGATAGAAEKQETPAEKAQREAQDRARRRHLLACHMAGGAIAKMERPGGATGDLAVVALAATFGCMEVWRNEHEQDAASLKRFADGTGTLDEACDQLWPLVREQLSTEVFSQFRGRPEAVIDQVARLLNLDMTPFREKALKKVPEPKEVRTLDPAPAKKAKRARGKAAAANDGDVSDGPTGGAA